MTRAATRGEIALGGCIPAGPPFCSGVEVAAPVHRSTMTRRVSGRTIGDPSSMMDCEPLPDSSGGRPDHSLSTSAAQWPAVGNIRKGTADG